MSSQPLFVKQSGTGPALIFLHGFLEDHTIWYSIYPTFVNAGYTCYMPDLPCHGNSRFEGENCSMQEMAWAVQDLIIREKIQHAIVIGHSMGGYVGLALKKMSPLKKLILLHSNFWADSDEKKKDRDRVCEVVEKSRRLFLNEAIPNLFAPLNREFRRDHIDRLIERADKIPALEIIAATRGLRDRQEAYTQMNDNQVIMIQGDNDPVIPVSLLNQELEKLSFKPPVFTLKNCGHMGFIEQPDDLIQVLKSVLIE